MKFIHCKVLFRNHCDHNYLVFFTEEVPVVSYPKLFKYLIENGQEEATYPSERSVED